MPFYYVQDIYHKSQLGALDKRHMIPGVNIISGRASVASISRAGGVKIEKMEKEEKKKIGTRIIS